ncbi:MAG: hypothetical protein ACK55Z_28440, partial [bacterium]
ELRVNAHHLSLRIDSCKRIIHSQGISLVSHIAKLSLVHSLTHNAHLLLLLQQKHSLLHLNLLHL